MYHSTPFLGAVGAAGTLPYTGMNLLWSLMAGFAVFAAGLAVKRIAPPASSIVNIGDNRDDRSLGWSYS